MKEVEFMQKRWDIVLTGIVVIAVGLFLALALGWLPIKAHIVLSGSMEPTIPTGSLVFSTTINPEKLEVADGLVFQVGGSVVTHRIVEIHTNSDNTREFVTRGDANNTNDATAINQNQVIGKVIGHIPIIGKILLFIQQNLLISTVIIVVTILGSSAIIERWKKS